MLEPQGIAHVGVSASNLSELGSFYQHKVGLRLIEGSASALHFDIGGGAILEIWPNGSASATRKDPSAQSVRVCIRVQHLESTIAKLASQGIQPHGQIGEYGGTRWIHYTDPEGNGFGFVASSS